MNTKIETYGQLLEKIRKLEAGRAKNERTQEWLDRFQGELAAKEIELLEAKAEWVKVFDDMVLVQQRTEAERDALRAEVERLTEGWRQEIHTKAERNQEVERLRAALEGVLAEADRKTDAFDKAHAALDHGN